MTTTTTAKTDDTSATAKDDEPGAAVLEPEELDAEDAAEGAEDDDLDAADLEAGEEPSAKGPGVVTGAAGVVAAALGLASLTGTWISDLMSTRQTVIGQINSQTGSTTEQLSAIYGTPWHTIALFNGLFALAAILTAGSVLLRPLFAADRREAPAWVRATALAGLILGVLGLLIAGVMWFDVFTDLPKIPATQ